MSILDSQVAPVLTLVTIFAVLMGFFRHLLVKVILIILIEIALFVLFPNLLVMFAKVIGSIRGALS